MGLVGADREQHEVRLAGEMAVQAIGDTGPLLVEGVVEHDDAAFGQGRIGHGEVVRRGLGGVAAIDADEAQRSLRQPHQVGAGELKRVALVQHQARIVGVT
jgi:hypothetical protein